MKAKIFYHGRYEDEIIIEGESLEELREKAKIEIDKRLWEKDACYSRIIKERGSRCERYAN